MSNDNKLKPCPFCGGDAVNENTPDYDWVECSLCQCQSESFVNRDAAITAWNRRASPWISVEERLPDKLDDYFVVCTDQQITKCTFDPSRQKWMFICVGVTHWMPLPGLPDE